MNRPPTMRSQRLAAAFVLGLVLFNYPVLAAFGRDVEVLGVPLLYVYLFGAWAALIALLAFLVSRR